MTAAADVLAAGPRRPLADDIDGCEYVDLCLADTGAMTGHGPPVVLVVRQT